MLIGGRLFTTILWGWLADRVGLRYSLAASMGCVVVGNLCFGFATSLRLSLLARGVFLGACNGFPTLMGPTCALAGPTHQAQAVAHTLAAGSAITMLGPALGGLTYASLGRTYPALAPSLIGASLAALATALCLLNLPHSKQDELCLRGGGGVPATQSPAAVASADYGRTSANIARGGPAKGLAEEEATELHEVPGLPTLKDQQVTHTHTHTHTHTERERTTPPTPTHTHTTRTTPQPPKRTPPTNTKQRSKVARRRCVPPPTPEWVAAPKSA